MTDSRFPTTTDAKGREFPCFAGAVLAIVVDANDRVLFMQRPGSDEWRTVAGMLERGEGIEAAALRELAEEAGPSVRGTYLGVVHADVVEQEAPMASVVSVVTLVRMTGGTVEPGDDMAGSSVRWTALDDLTRGLVTVPVPRGGPELWRRVRRCLDSYAQGR